MKLKILTVKYHRNGSGMCNGFMTVGFQYLRSYPNEQWIATFEVDDEDMKEETLRINRLADLNDTWRGDYFSYPLTEALAKYCAKHKLKASWSAAAFPTMEEYML